MLYFAGRDIQERRGRLLREYARAARPGDILHSGADIKRARAVLNFKPRVKLADGLKETLEFYRTQAPSAI